MRMILTALAACVSLTACQTQLSDQAVVAWREACSSLDAASAAFETAKNDGLLGAGAVREGDAAQAGVGVACAGSPPENLTAATIRISLAVLTINKARRGT